jgi:hypothetical protein
MSGIHKQLVAVLRGDNSVVQTTDGKIVVNLFPLLDAVFKRINAANVSLAGTTITAPTLSDPSDPAASRAELSTALGRQLSPTFGVVAVAGAAKLEAAQRMVTLFDALVVILFVLTALLALVTVALSRSRIRVVALLGLGGLAALLVARLIIASAADGLATAVIDGGPGAIIGGEIVKQVATTYREFARGILVISLVVAVVATALAWLVQRRASAEAGASGGGIVADEWLLGLAGLCVGLLALLFVDLTAASFAVVAIAYVIWLVIVIRWHRHATAATASGMPGAAAA